MAAFKDALGETWRINYTLRMALELKETLQFDIRDLASLNKLTSDPFLLGQVLFTSCREQIDQRGIDETQFMERLTGDSFGDAIEAVVEAVIDFYPPSIRPVAKQDWARGKAAQAQSVEMVQKILERRQGKITERLEAELEARIEQALRNPQSN